MGNKTSFTKLNKTVVNDGLGSTETAYKRGESFNGIITTKTYKNVKEGGIIEFIPYIILAYNPEEATLNYKDVILTDIGNTAFEIMDKPAFITPPHFSAIKFIQVRLELITHPDNGIING